MKRTMTILAIALLASVAVHAQNYSVVVTTNSTDLCPQGKVITIAAWTNNHVVVKGAYVVNTNTPPRLYWAVNAGTSTVMPAGGYGVATGADSIEWLRFDPERRRNNVVIFADISTTVYYTYDGKAATTAGGVLDAVRPARGFPGEQGSVKGIVSSGTATVNVELDYK